MRGIDILRYSHTLSNGEDLSLSMTFSKDIDNEDAFIVRCQYMYKTMSNAIHDHELRFGLKKPNVSFESGKITLGDN